MLHLLNRVRKPVAVNIQVNIVNLLRIAAKDDFSAGASTRQHRFYFVRRHVLRLVYDNEALHQTSPADKSERFNIQRFVRHLSCDLAPIVGLLIDIIRICRDTVRARRQRRWRTLPVIARRMGTLNCPCIFPLCACASVWLYLVFFITRIRPTAFLLLSSPLSLRSARHSVVRERLCSICDPG